MQERLILFSQPSSTVWEKLDAALFPEYLMNRVFAYMPSEGDAAEANAQYTPLWEEYAKKNHAKLVFIDNSKRGPEAAIEAEKLKSANILMITGGNTFKLLNHLKKSGLDKAIIEFWKKDGVVLAGFSAGAIVLSPSIETARTGCGDVDELGLTDLSGLGIVDFEIWPHYESDQAQEVADYKSKSLRDLKLIGNEEVVVIDK
jgi:dipeptidase E